MRREESLDPDDLQRPDWNSLKANYSKHDIAEAYFIGRMDQLGLQVEHWGIDMRHEDEDLVFDNKMDLRIWESRDSCDKPPTNAAYGAEVWREGGDFWNLKAIVDVKSKANPDWLGILNLRHLAHYAEHADQYDVPVFLYFTMVDTEAESVGEKNIIVDIPTDWDFEAVSDHFEHGNGFSLDWDELKAKAAESYLVDRTFRAPDGNPVVQTTNWKDFGYFEQLALVE